MTRTALQFAPRRNCQVPGLAALQFAARPNCQVLGLPNTRSAPPTQAVSMPNHTTHSEKSEHHNL
jgi:hypothetical protein